VTKRSLSKKAFPGKWTVPGGGLEVDDYIHDEPTTHSGQWYGALERTLRREIREEVNVEIGRPEYLMDLTFVRPDGIPVLVLSYYAKYESGEVKLDDDAVDYRWATLTEARQLDMIDGIWEEMEVVDRIIRGEDREVVLKNTSLRK
jgi:8-oxo-dGTP pyrophosphatase MutT (NUDIX family)